MSSDFCAICGAYFFCEHKGSEASDAGMERIADDEPSYRQQYGARANDGTPVHDIGAVPQPATYLYDRSGLPSLDNDYYDSLMPPQPQSYYYAQQQARMYSGARYITSYAPTDGGMERTLRELVERLGAKPIGVKQ